MGKQSKTKEHRGRQKHFQILTLAAASYSLATSSDGRAAPRSETLASAHAARSARTRRSSRTRSCSLSSALFRQRNSTSRRSAAAWRRFFSSRAAYRREAEDLWLGLLGLVFVSLSLTPLFQTEALNNVYDVSCSHFHRFFCSEKHQPPTAAAWRLLFSLRAAC